MIQVCMPNVKVTDQGQNKNSFTKPTFRSLN